MRIPKPMPNRAFMRFHSRHTGALTISTSAIGDCAVHHLNYIPENNLTKPQWWNQIFENSVNTATENFIYSRYTIIRTRYRVQIWNPQSTTGPFRVGIIWMPYNQTSAIFSDLTGANSTALWTREYAEMRNVRQKNAFPMAGSQNESVVFKGKLTHWPIVAKNKQDYITHHDLQSIWDTTQIGTSGPVQYLVDIGVVATADGSFTAGSGYPLTIRFSIDRWYDVIGWYPLWRPKDEDPT